MEDGTCHLALPDDARTRAADFVGRDWILDEIADWSERGQERYLLLIGEPGWGKSALAAWLVGAGPPPADAGRAAMLTGGPRAWSASHFCVARGQKGTVNPSQFARALATQLAQGTDGFAPAALER